MNEEWDWKLTDRSKRQLDALDEYARDRIISKLEEVVTDQWREPTDHLEPLAGAPHQKLKADLGDLPETSRLAGCDYISDCSDFYKLVKK
ncbi:hypothetical protein [Halorubrum sp. LN27]|uniref:type II toxin-antitoxin system RelE family toxin n=1 Tax=Halorubrum sp. LN27 TaxID=2801032 RepID=UPI00190C03D4|nr:hypothetical protein [Halorubrum sp. LN27]